MNMMLKYSFFVANFFYKIYALRQATWPRFQAVNKILGPGLFLLLLLLCHDFLPHLLTTKNASNHKMSENRPLPNIPTDSKTTFEIFKTKKSN